MPSKEPQPRLLIVEDEEASLFAYKRYFRNTGFEIITSMTLGDATRMVEAESFDAVLLDLNLPDGNAMEWLPKFKKIHPLTPVVVLSGTNKIHTVNQVKKDGADYFLTKPAEMHDILSTINKAMSLKNPQIE